MVISIIGQQLTQAEIGQLDLHVLVDQQILWLEIAVNDQIRMAVGERLQ